MSQAFQEWVKKCKDLQISFNDGALQIIWKLKEDSIMNE